MNSLFELHWIRPWWLLALLPLAVLLWWLSRGAAGNRWYQVCDPHLLERLLLPARRGRRWLWPLGLGWLLAVLALAGPSWEQRPQPLYQNPNARVLVLELSPAMLATDLAPSRLAQARFKIADILARDDARTALVVFADDAFVVTPLTHDSVTIRHLLAVLEPSLMPAPGSRPARGLALAGELLQQGGIAQGQILLIATVADAEAAAEAGRQRAAGHRVVVLGVGTPEGSPLPAADGELLKDGAGNIVVAQLDRAGLLRVAERGDGRYAELRPDDSDIARLLDSRPGLDPDLADPLLSASAWYERGPWLVLALLPLAALAFRRGWLLVLTIGLWPHPAPALDWAELWQRPEQRAHQALEAGQPERALDLSRDPWRQGTAAYRSGQFERADRAFEQLPGAVGAYNRGNALAYQGRYPEAVAAYTDALRLDPTMEDARYNRELVEQLLRDQPQGAGDEQQQRDAGAVGQDGGASSGTAEPSAPPEGADPNSREDSAADEADTDPPGEPAPEADPSNQQDPTVESLTEEQQQALDQWLRRVPDDPGGLLRRKFLYQYQRREAATEAGRRP